MQIKLKGRIGIWLDVWNECMYSMYGLGVCIRRMIRWWWDMIRYMKYMFALVVCIRCMLSMYVLGICIRCMIRWWSDMPVSSQNNIPEIEKLNSSVSCGTNSIWNFSSIWICTEEHEFLKLGFRVYTCSIFRANCHMIVWNKRMYEFTGGVERD